MSDGYDLRVYWNDRARLNGPSYVGPGNKPDLNTEQGEEFRGLIGEFLGSRDCGFLLDFGSGSGRLSPALASHSSRYLGVDIAKAGIRMAMRDFPDMGSRWLQDDAISLPDNSVDTLAAITVFQHIVSPEDWALWTRELRRVLKPEAQIFIIDMQWSRRRVHSHMRLRKPGQIGRFLGHRRVLSGRPAGEHWAGILGPEGGRI